MRSNDANGPPRERIPRDRVPARVAAVAAFVACAAPARRAERSRTCSRSRRRSLVAQVGLGLLLLSTTGRADQLHYAYGTFALLALLAPWLYAPRRAARAAALVRRSRPLVAAALAVRAYMTA